MTFLKGIKEAAKLMIQEDLHFQMKYNGGKDYNHALIKSYTHQIISVWKPIYSKTEFNKFPKNKAMAKRKIQIFQFALKILGLSEKEIPSIK